MYLKITERCNMSCAHCGSSCSAVGQDMSMKVFKAAVVLDSSVVIGGGEPTLHRKFWEMLACCIGNPEIESVWLATNGSRTEDALALAKMAKCGVIGVALSQDPWHDPIDPKVVKAFTRERKFSAFDGRSENDFREIRSVNDDNVINAGRCNFGQDGCICPEMLVEPSGKVRFCGCEDAPIIGDVLHGMVDPRYYDLSRDHGCYKKVVSWDEEGMEEETA